MSRQAVMVIWYARVCEICDDVVETRSVPGAGYITFGHWSKLHTNGRDVEEKKIIEFAHMSPITYANK